MTGPLCVGCGVVPVQRKMGRKEPKRGPRVIDGVRWRWFCSRVCASRQMGQDNCRTQVFRMAEAKHRQQRERVVLGRLVKAVKPFVDDSGRVPASALVKAAMMELRIAYHRGYCAGVLRRHPPQERSA